MRLSLKAKPYYRLVYLTLPTREAEGTTVYAHKDDFKDTDKVREYINKHPDWELEIGIKLVKPFVFKTIDECYDIPSSAPTIDKVKKSKSKKVFKIDDMWFFMRDTRESTWIYSIDLGKQLLCCTNKSSAMTLLVKRISEVKVLVDALEKE